MKLSSSLLAGDVGDIMYEELLPENVPLFGGLFGDRFMVNPSFRTAFFLTLVVLVFSLIFRFIIFPRFKKVPGTFQALIEKACESRQLRLHRRVFPCKLDLYRVRHPMRDFGYPCNLGGSERLYRLGRDGLYDHAGRRHTLQPISGRARRAKGFFPAAFHELPSFRQHDRRASDHHFGLSLHRPFFRRPRDRGRFVHGIPCSNPILRLYSAYGHVLRRSERIENSGRFRTRTKGS